MPRSTLKLPARPAPLDAPDETRSRKPVRSGFKTPKQSVAQVAAKKRIERDDNTARPNTSNAKKPSAHPKRSPINERAAEPRKPLPAEVVQLDRQPSPSPPPVAAPAPDPIRRPPKEPPRLSRRMSEMGLCSRREADEWIENGWVSVDGVVVNTLGARVHPSAKIDIKAAASKHTSEAVTILLNKPVGTLCGPTEEGQKTALGLVRSGNRWAEDDTSCSFKATHLRGLALAGKLDADSSGMLVFTQEGSVARRVTGDDSRLEKEYQVKVKGELVEGGLEKLRNGLALDDIKLKPAQVSWQKEEQLRFVLRENRPQQIQRMCELVGLTVLGIKRIRIGSVSLGKLPVGQWRYLRDNERF